MKKSMSLVLALMIVVGCLSVFAASSAGAIETWYVKTGDGKTLNVRDIKTGEVIGRLPYGQQVGVTSFQGDWAYIVYGGVGDAKVMKKYLVSSYPGKFVGPTDPKGNVLTDSALGSQTVEGLNKQYSTLQYVASYTVRVVPDTRTGTARMRWAPSKHSTMIALLPANYELTVLAANSNWLMVQDPMTSKIGYIAAKYAAIK